MSSVQEKVKTVGFHNAATLLEEMKLLGEVQGKSGARKLINSELWHACAGPLVSLPQPGSLVYYFPQGHSEQVTATTRKTANSHIPNYQSLPSQLMCQVHNVTLHADKDTDEIYAQMTLQPVNSESDVFPIPDFGCTKSKQPNEFFCKTLTASDTSTHGGFSVPRRAAEKLFPQLDYSMQPPNQELIVRDLHDNLWTFRHIYRGQPKRHLLTTGWSLFVGAKRLKAGDSVLFIRDEKSQLLLGVRRANRQQTASPSSVLSADSMHIGVLAAAAHAAANRSPFTVYYNPRACPSEFIIPLSKYHKAAYTQVSIGMRFGMMFETEESNKRRYMGTIVGISDYDPLRWPSSKWRNLQVEWDEHGYGERPDRVSLWEIETPESLFVLPSPTPSLKRQCFPGFVVSGTEIGLPNMIRKPLSQAPENGSGDQFPVFSDLGSQQLMKALLKPQNPSPVTQLGHHQSIYASIFQNIRSNDIPGACYSTEPTLCMMGSQVQQAEAVTKTVMQQKRQYSLVQQQNLPSENIRVQYQKALGQEQQEIVDLGHESWTYMETGEQVVEESHLEQKDQDQSDLNKHRNDFPGSKSGSGSLHETVTEKPEIAFEAVGNQVDGQSESIMERPPQQLHTQQLNQLSEKDHDEKNLGLQNHENLVTGIILNQGIQVKEQSYPQLVQQHLEPNTAEPPLIESTHSLGANTVNSLLLHPGHHLSQYLDHEEWMLHPSFYQSSTGTLKSNGLSSSDRPYSQFLSASENTTSSSADISSVLNPETFNPIERFQFSCMSDFSTPQCLPNFSEELLGTRQLNCLKYPPCEQDALGNLSSEVQKEATVLQGISNSCVIKDLSDESNNQSETYSNLHFEASSGSMVVDPCVSSTELEGFSPVRDLSFHVPSESLFGNFCSNQDVQSQVTSASLTDSQAFSLQEIPYSSGGTSCSNIDVNDYSFLHKGPRNQVTPQPLRTYTKVQKLGSVGRSIDVTRFSDYHELKSSIACMFGLEGQLNDPRGSEWKLVYVDYENDVLLVGDDPWEEFVNCVRCIRILSPSEVQQMSQEGMQLMNSSTFQFPPGQ